jgi:hypothetical protein
MVGFEVWQQECGELAYHKQQVQLDSDAITTHASTCVQTASRQQEKHLRKYLRCRELLPPVDPGSRSWLCVVDLFIWDDLHMQRKVDTEK